jgi:hypothetical protein
MMMRVEPVLGTPRGITAFAVLNVLRFGGIMATLSTFFLGGENVLNLGSEKSEPFFCVPSIFDSLEVKVLYPS